MRSGRYAQRNLPSFAIGPRVRVSGKPIALDKAGFGDPHATPKLLTRDPPEP
jgi:hypothetical protein